MSDQEIQNRIKKLLLKNSTHGHSKLLDAHYCYIKPSPSAYPFQYFWDTCFHIFMLSRLGEYTLARKNMRSILAMQEENGFIGHMIFWKSVLPTKILDVLQARPSIRSIRPHMSALVQPTFLAQAAIRIYEGTKDKEFLVEIYPKIKKYLEWLSKNRDFDGDGLLTIITPYESGIDWKPSLDIPMGFRGKADWRLLIKNRMLDAKNFINRYDLPLIKKADNFLVKEVSFNTIYILDLWAMSALAKILNLPNDESKFKKRAQKATESLLRISYDEKSAAFWDTWGVDNRQLKVLTPTIFFPIRLPGISKEISRAIIEKHLLDKDEFLLTYPIPSVAKNDPAFDPDPSSYLWRGPTWVIFNWFLYHCLKSTGYTDLADTLKITVAKLIQKSGFREYYNPLTGEGGGEKNFTWSGLYIDME